MKIDKQKSSKLDAVRGLAAFVVLLAHINQWFLLPLAGKDHISDFIVGHFAHFAVLVFFALSGFVITHSLVTNLSYNNGKIDIRKYVLSRFARIFPAGIFAISFSLLIGVIIVSFKLHGSDSFLTQYDLYVFKEKIDLSNKNILSTFLLSNGIIPGTYPITTNGPLWSLSIEFWAYFLALFVFLCIYNWNSKKKLAYLFYLFATLSMIALAVIQPAGILQFWIYWGLGSIFYFHKRHNRITNSILLALLSWCVISIIIYIKDKSIINFTATRPDELLLHIPIKCSVIIILAYYLNRFGYIPLQNTFEKVAKFSYTLYVMHFPTICIAFSIFHIDYMQWSAIGKTAFLIALAVFNLACCYLLAKVLENKALWIRIFSRFPILRRS